MPARPNGTGVTEDAKASTADDAGGQLLIELYGVTYDVTDFAPRHPGGEAMLRLACNGGACTDATRLFESYHVLGDAHRAALREHAHVVRGDPSAHLPGLSAFHSDVRAAVREYFGAGTPHRRSHKANAAQWVLLICIAVLFAACYMSWLRGSVLGWLLMPLVSWVLMANSSHDASHAALSTIPWVNDVLVWTAVLFHYNPTGWMDQHVVHHHTGTNEPDRDIDLYHFNYLHPEAVDDYQVHNERFFPMCLLTSVQLLFNMPIRFANGQGCYIMSKTGRAAFPLRHVPWSEIIFSAVFGVVIPGSFTSLMHVAYVHMVGSALFMLFTQVSHVHPECQGKDVAEVSQTDWVKGQAMTSMDYATDSVMWRILSGGLNVQSLHHCLPGVSSCHYTGLYPIFADVCVRHGFELHSRPGFFGIVAAAREAAQHRRRNRVASAATARQRDDLTQRRAGAAS